MHLNMKFVVIYLATFEHILKYIQIKRVKQITTNCPLSLTLPRFNMTKFVPNVWEAVST